MDAPEEQPKSNPSCETKVRPPRSGDTAVANALETNMTSPLADGQRFGDFQIRRLLGRGKAGFVYSADDAVAKHRCAVKLLCRMSSQDLYRNKLGFRRMSPFRHPCLMGTDRIEVIEDQTVLTMEEIEGQTLYQYALLLQDQPADQAYRRLLGLLHDYAQGLEAMHMSNLIHRDLKPTNLMVRSNHRGVIVDYGLVAGCDPETDPFGIRPYIAGTPRYFSPEALWDQSYTPAGDVFSLGLVMLDCVNKIAGSDACLRTDEFENWARDEDEQGIADAVSGLDGGIPLVLREAITEMLHADRSKRPSSIQIVRMTSPDSRPIQLTAASHLFGREEELEQCRQWIRNIQCGQTGRLHLYGEAGAGKTRLLDELERVLRQTGWGQVFRVKCRSRENQSLQVMDQIADQIAQRYARSDRECLRLDPVSASILIQSFPQLRHVVNQDLSESPEPFIPLQRPAGESTPERVDALSAAVRLSRQLRNVGPLFIIIDDAQWSDHDSNTVWDELQQDDAGFLGIISSSRHAETNQRQPADVNLELGPLPASAALAFLRTAALRSAANINAAGLEVLVDVSRGNAFRLQELAEEFRPGGLLHQVEASSDASISNLGDVDRFWRTRFEMLSDEAKSILCYIVTAGVPVSISQLAALTGFGDRVDVGVFALARQRLINDDATGKECITVVHDKIADGLIENLSDNELQQSHLEWARLLIAENRPRDFAARIAGHFYAAGQDGAALPFAILAAENADRAFAKVEAGTWHERVLEQVAGDARIKHLRDAARCFQDADLPEKAAKYYMMLAEQATGDAEQLRLQTTAVQLLIRSGQMNRARPVLQSLARRFQIPLEITDQPDSSTVPVNTIAFENEWVASKCDELIELSDELIQVDIDDAVAQKSGDPAFAAAEDQELAFCSEMSRSLSMLDLRTTLQLVLHACRRCRKIGDAAQRVHFGAIAGVWGTLLSQDRTDLLWRTQQRLDDLLARFENQASGRMTAEILSAIAHVQTLSMNWHQVPFSVDACVVDFIADAEPMRFEIAHTRWLRFWADWHLGQWEQMRTMVREMITDAGRRNDSYQQMVSIEGYGGNALLLADDFETLHGLCDATPCESTDHHEGEVEFVDWVRWIQRIQQSMYRGEFDVAAEQLMSIQQRLSRSLIAQIPQTQVTFELISGLTALHLRQQLMVSENFETTPAVIEVTAPERFERTIKRLQSFDLDFPCMLAFHLQSIADRVDGKPDESIKAAEQAAKLAEKLDLVPYQLAANDTRAASADPSDRCDSLKQRMTDLRVQKPICLERLYTVAPPQ